MIHQEDSRNLTNKYMRRLQKLKEKEAIFGINTPPEILIEIDDIERKIQELEEDLKIVTTINMDGDLINVDLKTIKTQVQKLSTQPNKENLSRNSVEDLAREFGLLNATAKNPHLRFLEGDVSYWYERRLNSDELRLQFMARKIILDSSDQEGVTISDQGKLSWAAEQIIPDLLNIIGELPKAS